MDDVPVSRRTRNRQRELLRNLNLEGRRWSASSSESTNSNSSVSSGVRASSHSSVERVREEEAELADQESSQSDNGNDSNDQESDEEDAGHSINLSEQGDQVDEEDQQRLSDADGSAEHASESEEHEDEDDLSSIPEDFEDDGGRESDSDHFDSDSDEELSENDDESEESNSSDSDSSQDSDEEGSSNESEGGSSGDSEAGSLDEDGNHQVNNTPLYPGAPITVVQSVIAILTLALTHHLTGACIADILSLVAMHCIDQRNCIKTLHRFKTYFRNVGRKVLIFHYYCDVCMVILESKDAVCENCEGAGPVKYFIELPLRGQLQAMFSRPGFFQLLQFRFNRVKKNPQNIEDVYDGEIYMSQFENGGFLSNPNNLSFMWYSDGISIFKKSNFQIWPLYLVINELSYKERIKKRNTILIGLWFGYKKPHCNLFLQPFEATLQNFFTHGYDLNVAGHQDKIRIKGIVLCGVCDMPAKSLFLRLKNSNGFYGCPRCKSAGARHPAGNTTVHVWPYTRQLSLRTNAQMQPYAAATLERQVPIFGVFGLSQLFFLMPDLIRGTGIDVMHGVFLGVSKLLTKLWFSPTYTGLPFCLSDHVGLVDARLKGIRPPSFVQRMPKLIQKKLAYWKALEYKMWLLYYSIPVLLGIMGEEYMDHHMHLVSAIYLLSRESVNREHIASARQLLHVYVARFSQLYGLRYLGINVHQLLHLPDVVLELGPLWVYSCFFLEDLNGQFAKLIHGTQHAAMQIGSGASVTLNLSNWVDTLPPESNVSAFCTRLLNVKKRFKLAEIINHKVYALGKYKFNLPEQAKNNIRLALDIGGGHFQQFYRLKKNGVLICSSGYQRSTLKLSSYVLCLINNRNVLCRIDFLVRWSNCNCARACLCLPARFICVGREYEQIAWRAHALPNVRLSYIHKVNLTNNVVVFELNCLQSLCFFTSVGDDNYISEPVNTLEAE